MTEVQSRVLPSLLEAHSQFDAIIRAKAGTGKTLTYLIPAVEHIMQRPPPGVGTLIVAPSRELVLQITRETEMLCAYHALQVVPLIGGVRRDRDEAMIRKRRPAILVGTPGRLIEHLESTFRFQSLFGTLEKLVLDECDELLQVQSDAVSMLFDYLPPLDRRQTLLVSATIPAEVRDLATRICRHGYSIFDCIGAGAPTPDAAEQLYAVCPGLLLYVALRNAISEEMLGNPASHKVIVFFPTARLAAFSAQLFRDQLQMPVREIHARCDGAARMVTQHEFNESSSGVLFTSGVSERGLDYPNVSLVVQVLAPVSREHYIHRVGRTARAGKAGRSLLLLLDREEQAGFLGCMGNLPLARHPGEALLLHDGGAHTGGAVSSARWALDGPLFRAASAAFASVLKHYRVTQTAVSLGADGAAGAASEIFLGCGLAETPAVSERLAGELGLLGCAGLRVVGSDDRGGPVAPAAEGGRAASRGARQHTPRWPRHPRMS